MKRIAVFCFCPGHEFQRSVDQSEPPKSIPYIGEAFGFLKSKRNSGAILVAQVCHRTVQ